MDQFKRVSVLVLVYCIFICACSIQSNGQKATSISSSALYNLERGIGVHGYDPVAYHTEGHAVKGNHKYSFVYGGVTYLFVSQGNLDSFKKLPDAYMPQYGGWCAYAMGNTGEKVDVDPETFKIISGKLYLYYNSYFNNTLKSWNKNEAVLKSRADVNWNQIITRTIKK